MGVCRRIDPQSTGSYLIETEGERAQRGDVRGPPHTCLLEIWLGCQVMKWLCADHIFLPDFTFLI